MVDIKHCHLLHVIICYSPYSSGLDLCVQHRLKFSLSVYLLFFDNFFVTSKYISYVFGSSSKLPNFFQNCLTLLGHLGSFLLNCLTDFFLATTLYCNCSERKSVLKLYGKNNNSDIIHNFLKSF